MTRSEKIAIYKSLCEQGKITDLFMQPWWLDSTGEWEVALAIRNGQVVGAMPFARKKRWGLTMITMPVMTHHLLIWMDKPPDIAERKWLTREKQIIWLLIEDLPPYSFFSMVFEARSFNNWLPFHWKGFKQEVRYTFEIEKTNSETIDQQINRNLKRSLNATKSEIELKFNIDSEAFFEICHQTYKRQKIAIPYAKAFFLKLDKAIMENKAGVRMGAFNSKGELVAVAYLLWDNDRAYYFLAGDNDAGRNAGASILLCREALHIAFEEKNLKSFDFCGSMIESITEMRRQFGAKPVSLMKIFKARYKLLGLIHSLTR
jgi:hypothetical protein